MRALSAPAVVAGLLAACTGAIADPGGAPGGASGPGATVPGPSGLRTLTPPQYQNSVRDVLGLDVPVERVGQWPSSIAAAQGGIAPATVLAYEESARAAAAYALEPARRDAFVGCTPTGVSGDPCAQALFERLGRAAFRRALEPAELARYTELAAEVSATLGDPYRGIELALTALLQSPSFLYRVELGVPVDERPGLRQFSSHEMATRISYLVWNTTPDAALLDAAERGELDTADGVREQVRRLLSDERARAGVRELFGDLFQADAILTTEKDEELYPFFTPTLRTALRDQLVFTAENAAFGGDLRAIFTTRTIYMNNELAALYDVEGPLGAELVPYDFPEGSARAGVLTLGAFLGQHAYPAKTSPALRGLFVRKTLLCQNILPPPMGVVTVLPEPAPGELVTTRDLLEERHETQAACAGCHQFMDPIGLALENFDAVARFRATQNELPIDPSGHLDGIPFDDAPGLGRALSQHAELGPCFVRNLHAYASGHTVAPGEATVIEGIAEAFVESGYQLDEAIVAVATSDVFRFAMDASPEEGP